MISWKLYQTLKTIVAKYKCSIAFDRDSDNSECELTSWYGRDGWVDWRVWPDKGDGHGDSYNIEVPTDLAVEIIDNLYSNEHTVFHSAEYKVMEGQCEVTYKVNPDSSVTEICRRDLTVPVRYVFIR